MITALKVQSVLRLRVFFQTPNLTASYHPMPIYEYQCKSCGHQFEKLQKMSDAPLTDCPSCGQAELTKLISAAGFQLKGTGWYQTDFRDIGKAKPAEKKSSDTQSGTSTSSDN